MRRRTYVAGRGVVSGFGAGRCRLAEPIFAGETAVRIRERSAGITAPTTVAAEVPSECMADVAQESDRAFFLARRAAVEALLEAGSPDPGGIGLVLASTKADLSGLMEEGSGFGQPVRLAERLAADLGLSGVRASISCACASGLMALSTAERRVAGGEEERLLVVGVDVLNEFNLAGFGSIHALDHNACRPFDLARRGISLGEGAAAILLSARAEDSLGFTLAGHGGANDACHVTGPDRKGEGLRLAASRALKHAGLEPGDIDLIHLHGTGTIANDVSEALGLVRLFDGKTAPAFGTKAQTGHTLGASGILESIIALESLRRKTVPANVRLQESGVDPRLDLVRKPRPLARSRRALKVAGGFAGIQAAIVFEA